MIGNFIELGLGGNGSVSEIDEPKLYFNLKSFLKAGLEVKKSQLIRYNPRSVNSESSS